LCFEHLIIGRLLREQLLELRLIQFLAESDHLAKDLLSKCVLESVGQVISHKSVLASGARERKSIVIVCDDTSVVQGLVLLHLLCRMPFEGLLLVGKETTHLGIGHLHALIHNDVAECKENEKQVVLGHMDLLLLDTIQARRHND